MSEALQPGDKVIWWKRIPGGDYVYPMEATVLALTAKRVKIEANDDGGPRGAVCAPREPSASEMIIRL